jgi:type IV pilus biogenesis protein CpaD/CtpE
MWRVNHLLGAALVFIAILTALLTGCAQHDPSSSSGGRAASDNFAIASNGLPEVVITAPRPRSKTIVLSTRATGTVSPR